MTALPLPPRSLRPLLTVAEYTALPEELDGTRYELVEGNLVMSPRPTTAHQLCVQGLLHGMHAQIPSHLRVVIDVDVDLALVAPTKPGFVRAPDLLVADGEAVARSRDERTLLSARDLVLAVEVISPGSRRLDTIVKRDEYADAGIPHYWVVDLGEPGDQPQLTAHHLAGEFGYADAGPVNGVFATTEPFAVRIDLDALV
jgi:Uma2 family endonuclease